MTPAIIGFTPATLLTWCVYRCEGGSSVDDWWAVPVLGWTIDAKAVVHNGAELEAVTLGTENVWTIVADAALASAWEPVRRAVMWSKAGTYALPTDVEETVSFGEREAA